MFDMIRDGSVMKLPDEVYRYVASDPYFTPNVILLRAARMLSLESV